MARVRRLSQSACSSPAGLAGLAVSTARDFFASESARSFCWRVMAVFASLMSSRAAKAESAHKAGQAVARDIRIIDADFIRHLPWQANNQLRAILLQIWRNGASRGEPQDRRSRRYGWKVRGRVRFVQSFRQTS